MNTMEFDYVVVGAGSAGCAVAARLGEDGRSTVLVVEAGAGDAKLWIQLPIGYAKTMFDPRLNWCYTSAAEPALHGRTMYMPAGKVLGGSSSINGLLYVRGQHEDYEDWARLGASGWSWPDVLPYFKRSQSQERGADEWHGADGPLHVSDGRSANVLYDAFIESAIELGIPANPDFNGAQQEGVGYYQMTARKGRRVSSAAAFLHPAVRRGNVTVLTRALASRLELQGEQVTGLRLLHKGAEKLVRARRSLVLCAGALSSPALLLRSGIGAPQKLERAGIATRHALPGVGENLQDHLQAKLCFRSRHPHTLNDAYSSLAGRARMAADYLLHRRGWLASAAGQAGGFARSYLSPTRPDVQFHVMALSSSDPKVGLDPFSGFTVSACQLRPHSRGSITVRGADPADAPVINFNYLTEEQDRRVLVAGMEMARQIARTGRLSKELAEEVRPGAQQSTAEHLLAYARRAGGSVFHPAGSCRMGTDADAVVDPTLRVRGLRGVFVADASVMPSLVSGNTNAASIMVGERAADFIRESA